MPHSVFTSHVVVIIDFIPHQQDEQPETAIGKNVIVNGTLKFDWLVRIDGSFTGQLVSQVWTIKIYHITSLVAMTGESSCG